MATTAYKNARQKAFTKAHLLLEIDLVGTGTTYDAYKTVYMSDKYMTVDGQEYEGVVLDFGGMDVSLPANEGISSTNDFSISLANSRLQFMESDAKFSDLFDDYYFAGSVCRVYQWFEELSSKDDAELIFTGICKQPTFDDSEVNFDIEEDTSFFVDIPNNIVTVDSFVDAPQESIGVPIPVVYGDDWTFDTVDQSVACLTPCIQTNKFTNQFYVANHTCYDTGYTIGDVKLYLEDIGHYGSLGCGAGGFNDTNSGGLYFDFAKNVYYTLRMRPTLKGSQYDAADTAYEDAIDGSVYDSGDATTYVALADDEHFYLKFDKMTRYGALEYEDSCTITVYAVINNVSGTKDGSGNYGYIKYYNAGFNSNAGAFCSGGIATADIDNNGTFSLNIISDKTAKGIGAGAGTDAWTWDEIAALEIGVETVNTGDAAFRISSLEIIFSYVSLTYTKLPRQIKVKR